MKIEKLVTEVKEEVQVIKGQVGSKTRRKTRDRG